MDIKSLTIYCSSSEKLDQKFYDLAEKIGFFLGQNQFNGKNFKCCIKKWFECNWRNP